ncbi:alpha/beta hydrolase family protein [Streptomyces sp. NBC_01754]|nr:alpha/beta hydrolase [Streptomyces sp. NBC_01754]WSC92429.1 alpha/beta hydrolase family protein [Streptomyces sp. NBC_01754]
MNGLPAPVRDEANHTILSETLGQRQMALDVIPPEPTSKYAYITAGGHPSKVYTDEWIEWDKKYGDRKEQLINAIKGIYTVQERYDNYSGEPTKQPYLLGFDDKNHGHVIMSIGNPDTADNVTTYVPGTGAKLSGVNGELGRAELLQAKAAATDPLHTTASIMWLGYDAAEHHGRRDGPQVRRRRGRPAQ